MKITTPTIMKILVSSPVVLGEVGGEGDVEAKPVVRMVREEGVTEGAVVVVETKNSPVGEKGDGGSPGVIVTDNCTKKTQITDNVTVHYLPILKLIIGAEGVVSLREYEVMSSGDILKPQALGCMLEILIAYCDFMSSLGRLSL